MLFAGEFERTLDAKNRTVMPPKLKDCLKGESFVLCCLPNEHFIRGYKNSDWEELTEKHLFADDNIDRSELQRYMFLNSENCELDTQNRFTVNPKFSRKTKITREVVIIGVGKRIEIWAKDEFEAHIPEFEAVTPIAATLFPY
jgi:MraZ protein